jgi:hypothetical protein
MSETEPLEAQPIELSLNAMWMLQPDYRGVRQSLEAKGYTLVQQLQGPQIIIAKKGTIDIFVNLERRVLGIESETSLKDILLAFGDLEKTYQEIGMEPSNLIFLEFLGSYILNSKNSPLDKINSLRVQDKMLDKIGSILEKELAPLNLSLTVKGSNPTSTNWLNLIIEPLYPSTNKSYIIKVVFRGTTQEVVDFAKTIEKRIPRIIEQIEGS